MVDYVRMGEGPFDDPEIECAKRVRVLVPFCDCIYQSPLKELIGIECLKRSKFGVYFHRYVSPFAGIEKACLGSMRNFMVTIETDHSSVTIQPYHLRYRGGWKELELDILEDIACLESLGIQDIEYLGYKGDLGNSMCDEDEHWPKHCNSSLEVVVYD